MVKYRAMCLTIPKKVISISGNNAVVENPSGDKQKVKSVIKIKIGDNVLTQSNVIIQKISKKQAQEIISLFKK
jgi:hydrogenase maturation factor